MIGLIFEELKEFHRQGRERYFAQWWNFVTIIMLLLFILAGLFWLLGSSALAVNEHIHSSEDEHTHSLGIEHTHSLTRVVKSITRDSAFRFLLLSNR